MSVARYPRQLLEICTKPDHAHTLTIAESWPTGHSTGTALEGEDWCSQVLTAAASKCIIRLVQDRLLLLLSRVMEKILTWKATCKTPRHTNCFAYCLPSRNYLQHTRQRLHSQLQLHDSS